MPQPIRLEASVMRPLYTNWDHMNGVQDAPERVRPLAVENSNSRGCFDKMIDHYQWGLAFCVIIDHLVDASAPQASLKTIGLIDYLKHRTKVEEEVDKFARTRARACGTSTQSQPRLQRAISSLLS